MRLPKDIVPCCALLVLAGVYGIYALDLPAGRSGDPGPAVFPLILAGALAIFSLSLMSQSLLAAYRKAKLSPEKAPAETPKALNYAGLGKVAIALVLTIGFVASFQTLGYIIGTALYTALISLLFRRDSLLVPILAAAITTAMLYVFFVMLLGVRLPLGLLQ